MKLKNKYITFLLTVSVFVLFFSYYYITSNALPHGAGPDWKSNTDVSKFIYEHGRLAVLPNDEASLHFTVYGGTRALRPPLSYIASATMAGLYSSSGLSSHTLFRKGSALLCALAVALSFYALSIYFSSYSIGFLGSTLIGLMPQFTFIASYNNDDSGAIFSATLMLAVLIRIYRYGVSNTNAILIGLAAGLIVLSKMTAWLLMPFVILFLLYFIRSSLSNLLRYTAIAGVAFVLAGGWWFGFNVYHYGIDDPIQKKITNTVIDQHRRLPPDKGVGFTAQGIGFYQLIIQNHKNFLGETAKSTIGNLDWLKLKVGPLQYTVYKTIFFFALFYYFFSLTAYQLKRFRGDLPVEEQSRQLVFETLLVLIILFQIIMYTWTNIYNDIQIQGKYIIPVFLAILVLFFSGLERLPWAITNLSGRPETSLSANTPASRRLITVTAAGLLFIIYMHWHAMVNYVVPFYKPPAYDMRLGQFQSLPLDTSLHQETHNLTIRNIEGGIEYAATGPDPKVNLSKKLCRMITGSAMLRLDIYSNKADTLQFFIDEGDGYSAKYSFTAKYKQGDSTLLLPIAADQCQRVRFDPFIGDGTLTIKSLQIANMIIQPRRN